MYQPRAVSPGARRPVSTRGSQHRHQSADTRPTVEETAEESSSSSQNGDDGSSSAPVLAPDFVQLYSYFSPALNPGNYDINAWQDIDVTTGAQESKHISSSQSFSVVQPNRFSLPVGALHSEYPSLDNAEEPKVLPHVVLSDPHLPWIRLASSTDADATGTPRTRVPWLAVLCFTVDELRLPMSVLSGTNRIFPQDTQQSTRSLSVRMKMGDLFKTKKTATPINENDSTEPVDIDSLADMIFLSTGLFKSLFTEWDEKGKPKSSQPAPCVDGYKYLAHVRNINTAGMAQACVDGEQGLFSVVICGRTGPVGITDPTRMIAHLVSIEGVESASSLNFPISSDYSYVALASLHSWNYECRPADTLDFAECLRTIGSGLGILGPPADVLANALKATDYTQKRVAERLSSGYTLVRYRLSTGDETVAFTRGPCIPHPWGPIYRYLDRMANYSTSLQIFDQEVGIMDISYSSAWDLGRSLAFANQSFAASLGRLRTAVYNGTIKSARINLAGGLRRSKEDVIAHLSETVRVLENIQDQGEDGETGQVDWQRRWKIGRGPAVPPFHLNCVRDAIQIHEGTEGTAKHITSSLPVHSQTSSPDYDLFSLNNPDWTAVLKWVLDKCFLKGIPPQYLVTDPSYIPPESLRFFYIDLTWLDAFLDGALSIANHLEQDDYVRRKIKIQINNYFYPFSYFSRRQKGAPRLPLYGFFLRSALVPTFPDLVVRTPTWGGDTSSTDQILLQELLDTDLMMCLLENFPENPYTGLPKLPKLTFTRPPHQQGYHAAESITSDSFTASFRKIYTKDNPSDKQKYNEAAKPQKWTKGDNSDKGKNMPYDWNSGALIMPNYAMAVYNAEKASMKDYFTDDIPTPEMMGIHMSSAIYEMDLELAPYDKDAPDTRIRRRPEGGLLRMLRAPLTRRNDEGHSIKGHMIERAMYSARSSSGRATRPASQQVTGKTAQTLPARGKGPSKGTSASVRSRATERIHGGGGMRGDGGGRVTSGGGGTLPPYRTSGYMRIQIFPTSTAYSGGSSVIPAASAYSNDLVFSITVSPRTAATLLAKYHKIYVCSVQLDVPIGSIEGRVLEGYHKTGADMVSNRSFYVECSVPSGLGVLRLSVKPKTSPQSVMDWGRKCIGLSFVLNDVFSSRNSKGGTVSVTETYKAVPARELKVQDVTATYRFDVHIEQ